MSRHFVVATPNWIPHHHHARALEKKDKLRLHAYAGRWVRPGVPSERTALNPWVGGLGAAMMRGLPARWKEAARYSLNPWFDRWVCKQLREGDCVISSYGYANNAMRQCKNQGGLAILDAGNSHPEQFWEIVSEEHQRWDIRQPPISRAHSRRALESVRHADWVIGLSSYVTDSFIQRGFPKERIFLLPRPVDLGLFQPRMEPRPASKPLALLSSGGVNLRKGTPYLFEALRLIRKEVPDVRLQLNRSISPSMVKLVDRYHDLPIDWFPPLDHRQLATKLARADIYILPTLEEGFARSVAEAMACGLPAIVTPNSGATDLITEGVNGSVIPIRDPQAICRAVLEWWEKIRNGATCDPSTARERLTLDAFEAGWDTLLERLKQAPPYGTLDTAPAAINQVPGSKTDS